MPLFTLTPMMHYRKRLDMKCEVETIVRTDLDATFRKEFKKVATGPTYLRGETLASRIEVKREPYLASPRRTR
mgnify:CR=1 FL=1